MAIGASACCPRRGSSGCNQAARLSPTGTCSLGHRLAYAIEGLPRRAGGVDAGPVERTQIVALLAAGDGGIGIGSVAAARGEASDAGVEIGVEEKAVEGRAKNVGGRRHEGALLACR